MMPHLGVLSQVHPTAALEVFQRDCLIYLGTCVAAKGTGKPGKPCFKYSIESETLTDAGEIAYGEIRRLPLNLDQTARIHLDPMRGFDVGSGPGKPIEREIKGGKVGVILDGRGPAVGYTRRSRR